jgi:DNA-binding MarR family transcriptional regulator
MSNLRSSLPENTGLAFLLSQVGFHVAAKFAERLRPCKLVPAHAGILRVIHHESGISQQKLAKILGIFPSRLVLVLDELQQKGLVQRTVSSADRRRCALHLTAQGQQMLQVIGRVGREHQHDLCGTLNAKEQEILFQLLSKIARKQGLAPGIHPGYKQLKISKQNPIG